MCTPSLSNKSLKCFYSTYLPTHLSERASNCFHWFYHFHLRVVHSCLQQPLLGQTKARNTKYNTGLPCQWKEPYYLCHYLLPASQSPINRKMPVLLSSIPLLLIQLLTNIGAQGRKRRGMEQGSRRQLKNLGTCQLQWRPE